MKLLYAVLLLVGMAGMVSGQEAKPSISTWNLHGISVCYKRASGLCQSSPLTDAEKQEDAHWNDITITDKKYCDSLLILGGSSKLIKDIFPEECGTTTLWLDGKAVAKSLHVNGLEIYSTPPPDTPLELQTQDGMGEKWDGKLRIDGRTYDCNHGDCEMPDTRWDDAIRDAEEEAATLAKRVKRLQQAARIFRLNKKEGMKWPEPDNEPTPTEDALQ